MRQNYIHDMPTFIRKVCLFFFLVISLLYFNFYFCFYFRFSLFIPPWLSAAYNWIKLTLVLQISYTPASRHLVETNEQ